MQYNSEANNQDLYSYSRSLVNIKNTDTTSWSLSEFTSDFNYTLKNIENTLFNIMGEWKYDDNNYTTQPIAKIDLTANTQSYAVPKVAMGIDRIDVKDQGGNWRRLIAMPEDQLPHPEDDYQDVPSDPIKYLLRGETIKLFPAPNYSQSASLRISIRRQAVVFATTDTTKEPGILTNYDELLAIGSAKMFAMKKGLPQYQALVNEYEMGKKDIKRSYATRWKEVKPAIRSRRKNAV